MEKLLFLYRAILCPNFRSRVIAVPLNCNAVGVFYEKVLRGSGYSKGIKIKSGFKFYIALFIILFITIHAFSQNFDENGRECFYVMDSIHRVNEMRDSLCGNEKRDYKFRYKQIILPGALIGIGFVGLNDHWLKNQNRQMEDELTENIDRKITIDDFSQYVPMLAVYGLNLAGIKGCHGFKDRTILLATSYLIMGITVNGVKILAKEERPDGSNNRSFPSGHTATAFMGAEFLWREYKDVSPWVGIAGYAVAAGTGFFRMYNSKHWLTDIVAGAGFGIISVKAAYWLYPVIKSKIFNDKHWKNMVAFPYYDKQSVGVCCTVNF